MNSKMVTQRLENVFPVNGTYLIAAFYITTIIWSLWILREALTWSPNTRRFPVVFTTLLIVFVLFELFTIVKSQREASNTAGENAASDEVIESGGRSQSERQYYEFVMLVASIALPVGIYLFGFFLVVPIFTLALSLFLLDSKWHAIGLTLFTIVIIYVIFFEIFGIRVYDGVLM